MAPECNVEETCTIDSRRSTPTPILLRRFVGRSFIPLRRNPHLVKRQIPQLPLDNRMKDRDGSGERHLFSPLFIQEELNTLTLC